MADNFRIGSNNAGRCLLHIYRHIAGHPIPFHTPGNMWDLVRYSSVTNNMKPYPQHLLWCFRCGNGHVDVSVTDIWVSGGMRHVSGNVLGCWKRFHDVRMSMNFYCKLSTSCCCGLVYRISSMQQRATKVQLVVSVPVRSAG